MGNIIIASGGFDPIHMGHIKYLKEAKELGDELIVILNTDEFLIRKKGYVFMELKEREEVLSSLKMVNKVIISKDEDQSVCKTLEFIYNLFPGNKFIFVNGGDRTSDNIPEKEICNNLGIFMAFGVGGYDKIQSSSELIKKCPYVSIYT